MQEMEGGVDESTIIAVPKKLSCKDKAKSAVKAKCDCRAVLNTLLFNFFAVFYTETSLETCVSIFSAFPHSFKPTNVYETWSAGLCWFFIVTGGVFLIGIVGFMVYGRWYGGKFNQI